MIVSQFAILGLVLAAVISFSTPFVFYAFCRRRMVLPWRNIAIGAGIFVLFALVLESTMHWYILKHNPVTSTWLNHNVWGFAAYASFAAGLFEETGRLIAMRFLIKRTGDPGTAVAYGLGHGGIEAILLGALGQTIGVFMALMMNAGRLDAMLAKMLPAGAIAKLHDQFAHLDFATALAGGVERICALLIQIGLSLMVWQAVSRKDMRWFFAAILIHTAVDFPAALAQKGMVPVYAIEAYVGVIAAGLLVFFLVKLPRKIQASV